MNILDDYSGFIPGLAISLVVSLFLGRRVGHLLGVGQVHGFALMMSLGMILSATVTPSHDALVHGIPGWGTCDLSRLTPIDLNALSLHSEALLNVLLFLPLGGAIGLCPPSRMKLGAVALAYAAPLAIEGIQMVAVPLGRGCESADVVDNLTGLTLGIIAATVVRRIALADSEAGIADARLHARIKWVAALAGVLVVTTAVLLMPAVMPAPMPPAPPTFAPTPTPAATPTPAPGSSVRVTSVPALLDALANNAISEIVVANGTYRVSPAGSQASNSLWIGARYAGRTNPVLVRAETIGGVTFDGGGSTYWIGLAFEDGAHHQTWQGFTFANGKPTSTGAIVFGGWAGKAAPHHITLRDITVTKTVTTDNGLGVTLDHAMYFSQALGGVHDILVDGYTVDGAGGLDSAVNFGHETLPDSPNAWNVTVRNMKVTGTETTIIFWETSVRNVLIEDSTITGATRFAVRYEIAGTNIVLRRVISTGSGVRGFYSVLGANPPGITLENCDLR